MFVLANISSILISLGFKIKTFRNCTIFAGLLTYDRV